MNSSKNINKIWVLHVENITSPVYVATDGSSAIALQECKDKSCFYEPSLNIQDLINHTGAAKNLPKAVEVFIDGKYDERDEAIYKSLFQRFNYPTIGSIPVPVGVRKSIAKGEYPILHHIFEFSTKRTGVDASYHVSLVSSQAANILIYGVLEHYENSEDAVKHAENAITECEQFIVAYEDDIHNQFNKRFGYDYMCQNAKDVLELIITCLEDYIFSKKEEYEDEK